MQNIKKIKNSLKASSKKQEFKTLPYVSLGFETLTTSSNIRKSKLTKIQYLNTPLALIKNKKEIKFPIETNIYNSQEQLIEAIFKQKENNANFFKLKNILVLNKEVLRNCNFTTLITYAKIRQLLLRSLKLATLLNYFIKKA